MNRKRLIIFLSLIIGISTCAFFLIKISQGYRLDFTSRTMRPSGLLVATSFPNQASIFIDGKPAKAKTATTLNLPPGEYEVEIRKDGYSSWRKKLLIEKELVTKTDAYLFPTYPDLKALTFTGASNPVISPDGKMVAFAVSDQDGEKNGIWVLDLSERPLGLSREARQILKSAPKGRDFAKGSYQWSTDSKQLLITLPKTNIKGGIGEENFLVDPFVFNQATNLVDVTDQLSTIKRRWKNEREIIQRDKLSKLPKELVEILEKSAKDFSFSPDETKILYTATASASIPEKLIPPLPGTSTQPESRNLEKGKIYVYDLKEDKNFLIDLPKDTQIFGNWPSEEIPQSEQLEIGNPSPKVSWFPTSKHLFLVQKDKISIIEYDNTNWVDVYSGPFEDSFVFPSGNKILLLASLSKDTPLNLYALSLR